MTLRALLALAVVLICESASGAIPAVRPRPSTAPAPQMVFYVVKGAPDACGPGCDRWIAVEGQIDAAAAPRFRKFLRQLKANNLPIYFTSPGGNLDQAVAMGAMLREKPVVARVGRSLAPDGFRRSRTATFSSEGLAAALERLLPTCRPAKTNAPMRTVGSGDSVAK